MQRELAALAIQRLARNDPRMAADQLEKIGGSMKSGEKAWAWSQIGRQAAQRHLPEAMEWYRLAGDAPLSDEAAEWKVRAALRVQDWGSVRASIERMPPALAAQPAWVYWLGRAYRAGGRLEDANTLFAKIAGQPDFYGSLANDELGRSTMTPPKASPPSREELAQVSAIPGVRRAQAFFRLNLRSEGSKEWSWALRSMSDRELLAASEIAVRAGNYDRAIAAADRTRNEHDYSLRYLAPYGDQVRPAARNQALDDAWVYGLMRQESRFISSARSNVGASGLMQLMPATAKWVANKIGLKDFQPARVNDTETNVLLGTTYMRLVLESLDNHPVLASAAYNAGPGRARRWRAERPLEGAIYAETIPFSETRDYVKKVMSNSVYYAALFDGKPQTLKNRLGVIAPRTGGEARIDDLP
jgi:soluble lytic murein transglycosylase